MRNFLLVVLILATAQAVLADPMLVTVDGHCYLVGESDHTATKVKFIAVGLSAVTDSTYTDASGYFFINNLSADTFNVEYSHAGFDTVRFDSMFFATNTTIPYARLLPPCDTLRGRLSGTLGPGPYHVADSIWVETGDSLRLLPGTLLLFEGSYLFRIKGTLLSEGTGDSIVFTTNRLGSKRWRGLRFAGSSSSGSQLAHCVVERGFATGVAPNNKGGAVYCSGCSPSFTNCKFQDSKAASGGGGVYCSDSSPFFSGCTFRSDTATSGGGGGAYCSSSWSTFSNCTFQDNMAASTGGGGGVYCSGVSPAFTNCTFLNNTTASGSGGGVHCSGVSPAFANCTFQDNKTTSGKGGGVYCTHSSLTFTICTFQYNTTTSGGGGGVYCDSSLALVFQNCTFQDNATTSGKGGGLYCSRSSAIFDNCTFENNKTTSGSGGGVYCTHSSPHFTVCTFQYNAATSSSGGGVYCDSSLVLERCTIIGNSAWEGGGAYCSGFSPTFTNCTLSGNSAHYGGGVYCSQSSPIFANCILNGDTAIWWGGGAYCFESSATFTNCTFQDNTATPGSGGGLSCFGIPSPSLSNCTFSHNSVYDGGGGVYCSASSPTIDTCTFSDNSAWDGSGVYCNNSSSPLLTNCILSGNSASRDGGGLYCCAFSSPVFRNCTLSGNSADSGGGAFLSRSSPTFNSTIIAFSTGSEIYFLDSTDCSFKYCDIFDTTGSLFEGVVPDSLGELCCTNVNGDSCDAFFNISCDPMFADAAAGDYHLTAGSCCINAGDPALPFDPDDGTIVEIGAFHYPPLAAEPLVVLLPEVHALHPNWPNPFNSSTMIRYDVPRSGKVNLMIFNLLGQRVATLVDGQQLAGSHTIAWNADGLPSGVYICQMEAGGFTQARKMLLVK